MFNNSLLILTIPIFFLEFYKTIFFLLQKNVKNFLKNYKNYNLFFITIFLALHFESKSFISYNYIICFSIILLFFINHQFNINYILFPIIVLLFSIFFIFSKINITIFFLFTELLSISLFTFLFFDFFKKNNKYKNILIIYFFSNFLTFFIGIKLISTFYNLFGTTNIFYLNIFFFEKFFYINFIYLVLLFILKLGQGIIFLYKINLYKLQKPINIFIYNIFYIIFIYTYCLIFLTFFNGINNYIFINIFIFITFFIFFYLNFFKNWSDFLIFSTWLFIFLQIMFIIFC